MSICKLDHSKEDVNKKLSEQKPFLPEKIHDLTNNYLTLSPSQVKLNEIFHLLKKYDLATEEERMKRNSNLEKLY